MLSLNENDSQVDRGVINARIHYRNYTACMHYIACEPVQTIIVKSYQLCKTDKNIYASNVLTPSKKPVELTPSTQR